MTLESDIQRIQELADNCDTQWDEIHRLLQRTMSRYRTSDEQMQLRNLDTKIREKREQCFEELYEKVVQRISNGEIKSEQMLRQVVKQLTDRAKPDSRRQDISQLRRDWKNRGEIHRVRQIVEEKIEMYRLAVTEQNFDFEEAKIEFLDKANDAIERTKQRMGNSKELDQLLTELRVAMREADKSSLRTLAVQREFALIIADLEHKPAEYEEALIDENGRYIDTRKRDEAIEWYQKHAEAFAKQKALQYLDEARLHLTNGRPVLAEYKLNEIETLGFLSEQSEEYMAVIRFRNEELTHILNRITFARQRLQAIPSLTQLDQAIAYFEEALDDENGWPLFHTIVEDEQAVSGGNTHSSQHDPYSEALHFILGGMEREVIAYVDLLKDDVVVWLPTLVSRDKLEQLETYLSYAQNRLRAQYGAQVSQLVDTYYQQINVQNELNALIHEVEDLIEARDFRSVHRLLRSYQPFIEKYPETFPRIVHVWNTAKDYLEQDRLFQSLAERATLGILGEQALELQLAEVTALLQRAIQIRNQGDTTQPKSEWQQRILDLQQLELLLQGQLEREDQNFTKARSMFAMVTQRIPGLFEYAQAAIREIEAQLQEDATVVQAIESARMHLDAGNTQLAYDTLIIHQDKRRASNYTQWEALFETVHVALSQDLQTQIKMQLHNQTADPGELAALADQLATLDPMHYEQLQGQVENAIQMQTAHQALRIAEENPQSTVWRRALTSWRKLPNPDAHTIEFILVNYAIAIVLEALDRTYTASSANESTTLLERALRELDTLAGDIKTFEVVNALRFLATVRQAEFGRTADEIRHYVNASNKLQKQLSYASSHKLPNHLLNQLEDFYSRKEQIFELARLSEDIADDLELSAPLAEFDAAHQQWHEAITTFEIDVQLNQWYEDMVSNQVDRLNHEINATRQPWHQLRALAYRSILVRQVEWAAETEVYVKDFCAAVDQAEDPTHMRNVSFVEYREHVAHLIASGIAFLHLLTGEVFSVPISVRQLHDATARTVAGCTNTVHELVSDLVAAEDIASELNVKITKARTEEDFRHISTQLKQTAELRAMFGGVNEFAEIGRDFSQRRKVFAQLQKIANEIKMAYEYEKFSTVMARLVNLESEQARRFGADNGMLNIEDRFLRTKLTTTTQVRNAIAVKKQQIAFMYKILGPLVEVPNEQVFLEHLASKQLRMRVVDLDAMKRKMAALQHQGKFDDALLELRNILNGNVNGNQPAKMYDERLLSIQQALDILRSFASQVNRPDLKSERAYAISDWANKMLRTLEHTEQDAEQLRIRINVSRQTFEHLLGEFTDTLKQLDVRERLSILQRSPRRQQLEKLRLVYHTITDRGDYNPNCDPNQQRHDAPVAPGYQGIDSLYAQYTKEIEAKLSDCPSSDTV